MRKKYRRYTLKSKQAKKMLKEISERLNVDIDKLFSSKTNVEVAESEIGKFYLVNGKPLFFNVGDAVLPTLFFQDFIFQAPKVVVDMGAVPFMCNGANVMAPGIVRIEGEFGKGDLVLIVDEQHGKPLALGESLYDSDEARNTKQGAVVKSVHFVSDKIWNFAKTMVG